MGKCVNHPNKETSFLCSKYNIYMRAEEGAIEKVSIDPETLEPTFYTVGDLLPRGICGSGMIDLLSEMLLKG
jgi:uncharacterized 2Fe-2S/4Fe-4S cluster protein (DUF4445 family)